MTDSKTAPAPDAGPAPADAAATPESASAPAAPAPPKLLTRLARHGYGVLALLCVLLWLPGIVSLPALDRDESRFAESSRQMLDSGNYVDIRFGQVPRYKKPVGIYWLQAAATAATGFGDHAHIWTYRLPSLLGGIAAAWATFWCASLFSPEAGFLAGLLTAASLLLTAEASMATTDAVQLAAITAMQGVLLRVWRAAQENLPAPSRNVILAGWAALALGILVKGPVAPAIAVATVIALFVWGEGGERKLQWSFRRPNAEQTEGVRRPGRFGVVGDFVAASAAWSAARAGWLKGTRPLPGIAVTVLLTAPWLIAIALESHGAFFQQSLGGDFASKLAEGQEGHGAPPGYYLLLSSLSFWPAILFILPGLGLAVTRRADPVTRFLIAWAGAGWLMMEAVPTKLPNYILPAYPPLAILAALWLLAPKDGPASNSEAVGHQKSGWRSWLPRIAALQFAIGLAAMAAVPALLPKYYATGFPDLLDNWPLLVALGLGAVSGLAALVIFVIGRKLMALAPAILAALILFSTLTAYVGPRLDQLWVSQRLAVLVAKDRQAGDPPAILAGYEEPSLVFALGADVDLTDGKGAADQGAKTGGLALVDDEEGPGFLARLAELEATATTVDDLSGFNYSRGKPTHITLYRVAPLNPGAIPKVE
jgi:4-amino-4-deoxy-L-arabinose transferase-like glycosyltransferase